MVELGVSDAEPDLGDCKSLIETHLQTNCSDFASSLLLQRAYMGLNPTAEVGSTTWACLPCRGPWCGALAAPLSTHSS